MATLFTDNIGPRKPTQDITLGTTGETITLPGNDLRVNTVKDKGGNTLWTSDGSGTLSSVNSELKGALTLLSTQTASNSTSISFTTQLTSTYDLYIFKFIHIHPITDVQPFGFQVNASGQTGFNEAITSTFFDADHTEGGTGTFQYEQGDDQANGTAYQKICRGVGNENDEAMSGELHLFAPSSTTYVKHFYSRTAEYFGSPRALDNHVGGYINVTAAITQIDFKFGSGNIDSGTIKLYGI